MLRLIPVILTVLLVSSSLRAQVSDAKMQEIYEEIKTPHKYGLVLVPEDNSKKMDCPTVFQKNGKWYMTYIVFDGRGYETWLAKSNDLLHWENQGKLMSYGDSTEWDGNQRAGYICLQDTKWGGSYEVEKYKGKYWMSYIGGKVTGYEAGELAIGIANTTGDPTRAHEWNRLPKPVLTSKDPDKRWWEKTKLFKSTVIRDKKESLGYPFVMYYNAVGDTAENNVKTRWYERIGMAVSKDMVNWQRYEPQPVMHHPAGITGDAVIQQMADTWVMFYFGAFWTDRQGAFNRFACSKDLIHWTDWTGANLIEPSEPYDDIYAHKSYVVKHNGVVYHFYCAVNKKD